jgi:hypothetical protein
MTCPYCSSELKPCGSMIYPGPQGPKVAEWARCVRCQHATVVRVRTVFDVSAPQQSASFATCA